jgi:hypothetical protein
VKFRVKSQLDHIEKGGILDDCGPSSVAALVAWASAYAIDPTAGDGIEMKKKITGQKDIDGKSDNGSSLAQLIQVARGFGAKARWAKSWADVVESAKKGAGIGIWVQQPVGYPEGQEVSAWHVKWGKWWAKTDKAHLRAGYGHATAAGYDVEEGTWYWACPTRSGRGAEAFGVKISEANLRKIADSKRVSGKTKTPDYRHTIIVEWPGRNVAPVPPTPVQVPTPVAPVVARVSLDEGVDAKLVAPVKAVEVVAPKKAKDDSKFKEEIDALGRVDWGSKADEAGKILARGMKETRGKKMIDKIKWIFANTGIDEALLEAARVGLSTGIAVMLATGAPILDMTAEDFRVVGSGAIAATLQVVVRMLNPDDPKFGVGKAKAARAAEKLAALGTRAK